MFRSAVIWVFAVLIAAGAAAAPGSATYVSLQTYLTNNENGKVYTKIWLNGVYNGLQSANMELIISGQKELFCAPDKITMTDEQVKSIIDNYITAHKSKLKASSPIDILLLAALKEVFPCP